MLIIHITKLVICEILGKVTSGYNFFNCPKHINTLYIYTFIEHIYIDIHYYRAYRTTIFV